MKWYHSFPELGISGSNILKEDEDFILSAIPTNLTGKTVLDLASFDGFYSYQASKRGAKVVVALDNGVGEEILEGPGFESGSLKFSNPENRQRALVNQIQKYNFLNSNIHFVPLNVEDMDKLVLNFDIIFCFGIFYHVKDIYGLFEKCYKKCNEMTIIEGAICEDKIFRGAVMAQPFEVHGDPTNFWFPSPENIYTILTRVGFKKGELYGTRNGRILMRVYKNE